MLVFGGEMLLAEHLIKMHMERGQKEKEGRKEGSNFKRQEKSLAGFTRDGGVSILICGLDTRKTGGCICLWAAKHSEDCRSKTNPGESVSGAVVECQELELCLSLWLRMALAIYFLIGLILMLSPTPLWDESPGSYSSQKGARLVPLLRLQVRPTF